MMIPVQYLLMNPTGNQTILVQTEVPEEKQPETAAKLMRLEPGAEQVGFLSHSQESDISLRMAGGEFCGNAAMSAAVYYGMKNELLRGKVTVSVSGAKQPVKVSVSSRADGIWDGVVDMPQPRTIRNAAFLCGKTLPVVEFLGISHVIVEEKLTHSEAERMAVQWCKELGAKALGLMFLNREENHLSPLVYVPAADTLFWESTCASGTTAIGAWLANKCGHDIALTLKQPGGTLEVYASPNGPLLLKGCVSCLHENTALIDD